MKTPIADMIAEMHGKGIPVELIVSAVAKVEEAMAARAVSTGIPVDTSTIDKRRAWDRERKRRQKAAENSTGNSTGNAEIPPEFHRKTTQCAFILKEERGLQGKVVEEKKERKLLRGSRIPPEFSLDESDYEFAAGLGFSRDETDAEIPRFIDYWSAVPGAKGVKLTWKGTWRNRMRDLKKYRGSHGHAISAVRTDPAAGRATARETHHVASVGSAALRYLKEGMAAGSGGDSSRSSSATGGFDDRKRTESSH